MIELITPFLAHLWRKLRTEDEVKQVSIPLPQMLKEIDEGASRLIGQGASAVSVLGEIWVAAGGADDAWEEGPQVVALVKQALARAVGRRAANGFMSTFARAFDKAARLEPAEKAAASALWREIGSDDDWPDLLTVLQTARSSAAFSESMIQRYVSGTNEAIGALSRLVELCAPCTQWHEIADAEAHIKSALERTG